MSYQSGGQVTETSPVRSEGKIIPRKILVTVDTEFLLLVAYIAALAVLSCHNRVCYPEVTAVHVYHPLLVSEPGFVTIETFGFTVA
jgi:hypothetical protein